MDAHSSPKPVSRGWLLFSGVVNILVLSLLLSACQLPSSSGDNAQQTLSAMIVQSTLIAEGTRMAAEFSATQMAMQSAQQVAPVTEAPANPTAESPQPPQVSPTVEVVASPTVEGGDIIKLTAWEMVGWNPLTADKCDDPEFGCWGVLNFKVKTSLTSEAPVFIDPSWTSPYLVFWSKHDSEVRDPFGFLMISSEGTTSWEYLDTFASPKNFWQKLTYDLSKFKGQNIQLRFYCEPVTNVTQMGNMQYLEYRWYIQDVSIDPSYSGQ